MARINKCYPDGLSDKELKAAIKQYSKEITTRGGAINAVMQFSPLIQLGCGELQNRQSKRYMKISLMFMVISFMISIIAVYLAYSASSSSLDWKTNQLTLMERLIEETQSQSETQLSISKSRSDWEVNQLALMERLVEEAQSQSKTQLSISDLELVNRNIEMLQKNTEKRKEKEAETSSNSENNINL